MKPDFRKIGPNSKVERTHIIAQNPNPKQQTTLLQKQQWEGEAPAEPGAEGVTTRATVTEPPREPQHRSS